MASKKQRTSAKQTTKKPTRVAREKRTITKPPKRTRTAIGKEGLQAAKKKRARKIG